MTDIKLKSGCELDLALWKYETCIHTSIAAEARAQLLEVIRDMLTRFLPRSAANKIMGVEE